MSLIGTYRVSGSYKASSQYYSDRVMNVIGIAPSGTVDSVLIGVGLYVFSGTSDNGSWVPMRREWFGN